MTAPRRRTHCPRAALTLALAACSAPRGRPTPAASWVPPHDARPDVPVVDAPDATVVPSPPGPTEAWRATPRGVRQLAAGEHRVCALLDDGTVRCAVALPVEDASSPPVPGPFGEVPGVTHAEQLAAGGGHVCARLAGGEVRCWGDNPSGELGVGTRTQPDASIPVAGLPPVTSITASDRATCGLTAAGEVWCWGDLRAFGAISNARRDIALPTPTARRIPGLSDIRQLALARWTGCAVNGRGEAWCWGLGAGCHGPARTDALRGATGLTAQGPTLVWRSATGGWTRYLPNTDVCEEETNTVLNNCRAPIAQRLREHPGVPATTRAVFLAPYGCGGMRLRWVDDEGRVRGDDPDVGPVGLTGVAQVVQDPFDDQGIWLRAADGRIARVLPPAE